eukprot:3899597-Pyramimonas_sp.AAC.1
MKPLWSRGAKHSRGRQQFDTCVPQPQGSNRICPPLARAIAELGTQLSFRQARLLGGALGQEKAIAREHPRQHITLSNQSRRVSQPSCMTKAVASKRRITDAKCNRLQSGERRRRVVLETDGQREAVDTGSSGNSRPRFATENRTPMRSKRARA